MLRPSTLPRYVALAAEPFEFTYLGFPRDAPAEHWARLVARWLPHEADTLLGLDSDGLLGAEESEQERTDRDVERFDDPSAASRLDYEGRGVIAARAVCEAAVAECGREVWEGSDAETLSTLVREFPPADEDLPDDARRAWRDLWSTFRFQEADEARVQTLPWWIPAGYENEFAGLSSPAFIRDLVARLRETDVVASMVARLTSEGLGEDARDLRPLVRFLEGCAVRERWVLGIQGA